MAGHTENPSESLPKHTTEAPKVQASLPGSMEIHEKAPDIFRDNAEFLNGLEKFTAAEKQQQIDQAQKWEKDGALDLFRSAGLSLAQLQQAPLDRHIQLGSMFLKRQPGQDLTFQCHFNGNEYAETQVDLSDILPPNILSVGIYDTKNNLLFANAERGFQEGRPGYFTADKKRVFIREGFSVKINGSQSVLAIKDQKQGLQTYQHALKDQIYLQENYQKGVLRAKAEEEAAKQGKTLLPTPEFYDRSLTTITRAPNLEDIFKDGKFDFAKIITLILALVSQYSATLDGATKAFASSFESREADKQKTPVHPDQAKPAREDRPPASHELANPSKYEALPNNEKDRTLVETARRYVGSKDFRTPDVSGGNLACAKVASTILKEAGVIEHVQLGVGGVQTELLRRGWTKHAPPAQAGDVVIWGRTPSTVVDGVSRPGYGHIGIMTGAEYSVNNSSGLKTPVENKVDFNSPRGVYLLSPPHRSQVS